jgi:AraC-like DNA-binding protein
MTTERAHYPLVVPAVAHVFEVLRIPATLCYRVPWRLNPWWPIHSEATDLASFEVEHGVEAERYAYNDRMFAEVEAKKKVIHGQHRGCSDLFVPVMVAGKVVATLVTGPFLVARPSSDLILERWRSLTGRQGQLADPEFASFLRTTLGTLVLDRAKLATFARLLDRVARLIAGQAPADELSRQTYDLRPQLEQARAAERMWEIVDAMVDERSPYTWRSVTTAYELGKIGLSRAADQLLVALAVGRASDLDQVDAAVGRDSFQRSCAELAGKQVDVIAGRVGDHGVVFLSGRAGSAHRKRQKILEVAERASALARQRFGLSLSFGVSAISESTLLSRTYQAALGAAESALTQGVKLVIAEGDAKPPQESLRLLRQELGSVVEERPGLLAARFDRYLEAVAVHCGYRIEPARAQLEVGFERVTEVLTSTGALDPKSFAALCEALDRSARAARTMGELFTAYRSAIADASEAVLRPVPARHDRSLRAAVDYIRQHYSEKLSLEKVARVAGFYPSYFSELFKKRERVTFERYVAQLRLHRSKQLLASTDLDVTRVAELSGYRSLSYFCRVFRRALGSTPQQFRVREHRPKFSRKPKKVQVGKARGRVG